MTPLSWMTPQIWPSKSELTSENCLSAEKFEEEIERTLLEQRGVGMDLLSARGQLLDDDLTLFKSDRSKRTGGTRWEH